MVKKTKMLHIRLDPQLKYESETILEELGLSLSQAINIYLKQIIMTGGIPFNVKLSPEKLKLTEQEQKSITVDEIFREMGL